MLDKIQLLLKYKPEQKTSVRPGLMVIVILSMCFCTHTPTSSNQNAVSIGCDVLTGCFFSITQV